MRQILKKLGTLALLPVILFFTLSSCNKDSLKSDPMSSVSDLQLFVYKVEAKYKREASRNDIDLHFTTDGKKEIKITLTYKNDSDQDLALSIAEAAVTHVKRLLLEEKDLKASEVRISTEVKKRDKK